MPKIVINDPTTGKSYQSEFDQSKLGSLVGKKIGDEIEGGFFGLGGYTLRVTGGTDKQGFPMRPGIHKTGRTSLLLKGGQGYAGRRKGVRRRKTVAGELISDEIEQLNLTIVKKGKMPIEDAVKKEGE